MLSLLKELANPKNKAFRDRFAADPAAVLKEFKITPPPDLGPSEQVPAPERYREVLEAMKSGRALGQDLGEPAALGVLGVSGSTAD